jgi:hypothetical protein
LGLGDELALERLERGVIAQQGPQQLVGARRRQWVEANLVVVRLAAPSVGILRAIVD